jgi:hypothetical protein
VSARLPRQAFGAAALAFGAIALVWPDYKDSDELRSVLNAGDGPVVVYAVAIAQIAGGAALQFARTASGGAVVLGAVYLALALTWVPGIFATPLSFDNWGNFFEQFSLVTGAALVYARSSSRWAAATIARIGGILVGACSVSFALYQAFYLTYTASLVPKWLPPNQMFWSVATTVLFALAAAALLTNRLALLATRLQTMMLAIFGFFVWVPALVSDPHSHSNWSETITTFAIAGTSWILADLLGTGRR